MDAFGLLNEKARCGKVIAYGTLLLKLQFLLGRGGEKIMNKNLMWGLVVAAFIIGGLIGFYIERSRATDKMEAFKMDVQKQLDSAKMMAEKNSMMGSNSMMKDKENIMMMAMQDTSSKKGDLKDVSGGTGTGKAFVLRKDGKLYFTASANLPDPKDSTFYEGWLVKKGSNPVQFEDTGKLEKQKDGTYEVSYSSDNTYEGYDFVVVTWEKVDDQKPEKHILEGTVE